MAKTTNDNNDRWIFNGVIFIITKICHNDGWRTNIPHVNKTHEAIISLFISEYFLFLQQQIQNISHLFFESSKN